MVKNKILLQGAFDPIVDKECRAELFLGAFDIKREDLTLEFFEDVLTYIIFDIESLKYWWNKFQPDHKPRKGCLDIILKGKLREDYTTS